MSDWAQVRTIVAFSFRQELRQKTGRAGRRGTVRALLANLALYVFSGFALGLVASRIGDPFTGAFLASSALMVLTAVFVLMEFATIATGPEDHLFYAPRPVSSSTYFMAKLSVVLLFTLAFTAAFALPVLILLAVLGKPAATVAGTAYSMFVGAPTMSLLIVTACGLLVRAVPYARVRGVAQWIQLILFVAVYGGYAVVQRLVRDGTGNLAFASPLFLLSPSAWGAAVLRMGEGGVWAAGAVLSLAAPALFAWIAARILSPDYGARMSEVAVQPIARVHRTRAVPDAGSSAVPDAGSSAVPDGRGRWWDWIWRSPEEKAVRLLIANHFRHDSQFRLGIVAIIPVTLVYILILLFGNRVPILDPFIAAGRETFGGTFLLYFAVGIFPFYLKNALVNSSQAEASWIFHASPADKLLLLRASRRFIVFFFLLPYLALLGVVFAVFTGSVWHAAQHFLVIQLLCLIETDYLLLFFPELPFSRKARVGQRSNRAMLRMATSLIALLPLFLFVYLVYPIPWLYPICVAGLFLLYLGMRAAGGRIARRKLAGAEYEG